MKEDAERAFLLERAELGPSTSAVDLTVPHRGQRRASVMDGSGGSLETALPGREKRDVWKGWVSEDNTNSDHDGV